MVCTSSVTHDTMQRSRVPLHGPQPCPRSSGGEDVPLWAWSQPPIPGDFLSGKQTEISWKQHTLSKYLKCVISGLARNPGSHRVGVGHTSSVTVVITVTLSLFSCFPFFIFLVDPQGFNNPLIPSPSPMASFLSFQSFKPGAIILLLYVKSLATLACPSE